MTNAFIPRVLSCRINDEDVRLMLWDTAGQEEFDAITKAYYRGSYNTFISSEISQKHCKGIRCLVGTPSSCG